MRARVLVFVFVACTLACDPAGGLLVRTTRDANPGRPANDMDASSASMDADVVNDDAAATLDAALPDASIPMDAALDAGPRDPGTLVGNGVTGYYYAARQSDFPTGGAVSLTNTSCAALIPGGVSSNFANAICIEGVGKLNDGRVLQFAGLCAGCSNAYVCPANVKACFYFENASQAPWGRGSSGRPLVPLRSLAVDPDGPLLNKVLYLAALDGRSIAASSSSPAFTHDGCVRADDTGELNALLGFRLFTGDETQYTALNAALPGDSSATLHDQTPHCQVLTP